MANFKRGLSPDTLPVVKEFFFNTDVGKMIKDMNDLDICIRDNYINIYKEGCSLLKYSPNDGNRAYEIHHKYISEPVEGRKYVYLDLKEGDLVSQDGKVSFIRDVLEKPNPYLRSYLSDSGKVGEKHAISAYLRSTNPRPFLLDLEIAYTEKDPDDGGSSAPRIDMACIDPVKNELLLIEVKIGGDPRVRLSKAHINKQDRDKDDAEFRVVEQMEKYKKFIYEQDTIKKNITKSYRTVANNYIDLELNSRFPGIESFSGKKILEDFGLEGKINPDPYLLLFTEGFNMVGPYGDNVEALKDRFDYVGEFHEGLMFRWQDKAE